MAEATTDEWELWIGDLPSFSNSAILSDITVRYEGGEFQAHKVVLAARSDYFKAMFTGGYRETTEHYVELQEDNVEALVTMLGYFYDKNALSNLDTGAYDYIPKVTHIFVAAEKYQVAGLKKACLDILLRRCTSHWDECRIDEAIEALGDLQPESLQPHYGAIVQAITGVNFLSIFNLDNYPRLISQHPTLIDASERALIRMEHVIRCAQECALCHLVWTPDDTKDDWESTLPDSRSGCHSVGHFRPWYYNDILANRVVDDDDD